MQNLSLRNILVNRKYLGIYTYNGLEIPGGMPQIIPNELFEQAALMMAKHKKAPARARAKVEYLLTTKLFCGHCKEMMTGYSATGNTKRVYRYYTCNGRQKKICNKKMVNKDYIENLVVSECRKLLTDENIRKIAREIETICKQEKETGQLKALKTRLAENERKHRNLLNAIVECNIESVRKTLYAEVPKIEKAHEELTKAIAKEEKRQPSLTAEEIRFFLKSLQKGNADDIKYRKALISIFINCIYLYDDKIILIFNSGDVPVTISESLLSEIEDASTGEASMFYGKEGPPHLR